MRLIDADRLMTKRMQSVYYHLPNGDTAIPIIDIEHAPTIEVPEIVLCKDCKWYKEGYDIDGKWFSRCNGSVRTYGHTKLDWFCADGERRDNDA